jgi:hypothetical protein
MTSFNLIFKIYKILKHFRIKFINKNEQPHQKLFGFKIFINVSAGSRIKRRKK